MTNYKIKHLLDPELIFDSQEEVSVKIKKDPFAKGMFRVAYYLKTPDGGHFVAKKPMLDTDQEHKLKVDIRCHLAARELAKTFTAQNPPKKIEFPPIFLIQFKERNSVFEKPCFMTVMYFDSQTLISSVSHSLGKIITSTTIMQGRRHMVQKNLSLLKLFLISVILLLKTK
jgi:hypothetical protein